MKGRRLWLRTQAHGGTIAVYVAKGPLEVNGDGAEAYYDRDASCIVIEQCENRDLMKMRLHHELIHVCFGAHSGDARAFLGRTPAARAKREEQITSFLEPVQFDLLVRNGWLRYPNPPKVK